MSPWWFLGWKDRSYCGCEEVNGALNSPRQLLETMPVPQKGLGAVTIMQDVTESCQVLVRSVQP